MFNQVTSKATQPKPIRSRRPLAALSTGLLAGAALLAGVLVTAAPATAAPITPPVKPAATTLTVPTPYDDMSSSVCPGSAAIGFAQILTPAGSGADVWALDGDTVEFIGLGKACIRDRGAGVPLEWGFTAPEMVWSIDVGGTSTDLGSGTAISEGRTSIPTVLRLTHTVTTADNGAELSFGTNGLITGPNSDRAGAGTSVTLNVVNPKLTLVKQVCTAAEVADCLLTNDKVWADAATVPTGRDVVWRLTAKNDGNVDLTDVRVADDQLDGGTADTNGCVGQPVVPTLAVGASASIVCTTRGVTGKADVVNSAKLTSEFTDPSPDGSLTGRFPNGVESNIDPAQVTVLTPGLSLLKEVCVSGTGCDATKNEQWVSRTVVPLGTDAEWRLTATNKGNTRLVDVAISSEVLSGGKTGVSAECGSLTFGSLDVDESASVTCVTPAITDTSQDTVNTATAHGKPIDAAGFPLPGFAAGIDTAQAQAAVATSILPLPIDPGQPGQPGAPGAPGSPAASGTPSGLASTGLDIAGASLIALALLASGLSATVVLRRRTARD